MFHYVALSNFCNFFHSVNLNLDREFNLIPIDGYTLDMDSKTVLASSGLLTFYSALSIFSSYIF